MDDFLALLHEAIRFRDDLENPQMAGYTKSEAVEAAANLARKWLDLSTITTPSHRMAKLHNAYEDCSIAMADALSSAMVYWFSGFQSTKRMRL